MIVSVAPPNGAGATNWSVLALVRFALACIVVAVHVLPYDPVLHAVAQLNGKAAVVGFMLVSGYSIAASLHREPSGFMVRRVLRIYPLYFGAVLLTLLVQALLNPQVRVAGLVVHADGPWTIVGNFLLLQMYLCKTLAFNGPMWTLSLEFWYYALAPLFLRMPRTALTGLIFLSGVVFAMPRVDDASLPYAALTHFNGLRYLWSWLLGFYLYHDRRPLAFGLATAFAFVVFPRSPGDYEDARALLTIGAVLVAIRGSGRIVTGARARRVFGFLGGLSYPLYLVHFPLMLLLFGGAQFNSPWTFVGLALLLAWGMERVFDGWAKRAIFTPLFTALHARLRVAANRGAGRVQGLLRQFRQPMR